MSNLSMTPEAKATLRRTIGKLRGELLQGFRDAADTTYLLAVRIKQARLSEAPDKRRERLEGWIDEQIRAVPDPDQKKAKPGELRERFLNQAIKEASSTLLNRLILLRIMEAFSAGKKRSERLVAHDVITKGWMSPAYKEFREAAPALCEDATEGFVTLLDLVFDELSFDLPGLFGNVGLTRLFPIPPATFRAVIEALNDPALDSAWTDDTTLGWVYQYWNDPDREALDAKINAGGKIESHEIASKTQMFTERYMVEWLLQNSLGLQWLCICQKHNWTPDAKLVLDDLDKRRANWRLQREKGDVTLDALMPIHGELEEHWKYFVPQPIPQDMVDKVTDSVRALKILDPACGSGHFLVIAFDLLVALYREEARHRGEVWTNKFIAERILENNLHGVDIDPRAVQIAAAALFVKARAFAPNLRVKQVNLVAPALRLARLPAKDPALEKLRKDLRLEAGIPDELTNKIIDGLKGVDHLGTLLKVDKAIDDAIDAYARPPVVSAQAATGDLFTRSFPAVQVALPLGAQTRATVLDKLEPFLARHAQENDLGLRLDGEQLAAGVRFVRMVKEGAFDLVVGNPPYQGTSKMADTTYVTKMYPKGKADLYAAFLERGLELVRASGISAMVTMRGWMFLGQFQAIREHLLESCDLRSLGDVDRGAFEDVLDEVLATTMSVLRRTPSAAFHSVALQPTPPSDRTRDAERTKRKRAAMLAQVGRYEFDAGGFGAIEGKPIVYWWSNEFLRKYAETPKVGQTSPGRAAQSTGDNLRFTRAFWEILGIQLIRADVGSAPIDPDIRWHPFIAGADGAVWFEPLRRVVDWGARGLHIKQYKSNQTHREAFVLASEPFFYEAGVAFTKIGSEFNARIHRYLSVFSDAGSSVFSKENSSQLCLMNSRLARFVLESLNPTINFQVGDVNRLPIFPIKSADQIYATIERAFTEHEAAREASVEFKKPGPSPWIYAQQWAQQSVDRPAGEPLPAYSPTYEPPSPADHLSFAIGVALGRFGANGEGLLDNTPHPPRPLSNSAATPLRGEGGPDKTQRSFPPLHVALQSNAELERGLGGEVRLAGNSHIVTPSRPGGETRIAPPTLPAGILYISPSRRDSLDHPAVKMLRQTWTEQGRGDDESLRDYFRKDFFADHKSRYENRPIYFPLTSAKKSFVALVSIHRFDPTTLQTLLADWILPDKRSLDGEMTDLREARRTGTADQKRQAERRSADVQKMLEELDDFISKINLCADKGAPPADKDTKPREKDARYVMDLDDGVMVNSAGLWPLLEPQWKDPKKWWKELCNASGKKDYDWSHLAARYFPERVDEKCRKDPSLGVAHGCFWRYHKEKAYAWELRLQDEIGPAFLIEENDAKEIRERFLKDEPAKAREIVAKEMQRRERKKRKDEGDAQGALALGTEDEETAGEDED